MDQAITISYCTPFFPSCKEEIYEITKNFQRIFQGKYRKMPKFAEEGQDGGAKQPFPGPEACRQGQIPAQPQVPPAEPEGDEDPGGADFQGDQQLGRHREPAVRRPEQVHCRPQQDSRQKAAPQLPPYQRRGQRHSLRFCRGSS